MYRRLEVVPATAGDSGEHRGSNYHLGWMDESPSSTTRNVATHIIQPVAIRSSDLHNAFPFTIYSIPSTSPKSSLPA